MTKYPCKNAVYTLYGYQLTTMLFFVFLHLVYAGLADGHGAAAFRPPATDQERLEPRSEDGKRPASALLLLVMHTQKVIMGGSHLQHKH